MPRSSSRPASLSPRRLPAVATVVLGAVTLVVAACGGATASASPSAVATVAPATASPPPASSVPPSPRPSPTASAATPPTATPAAASPTADAACAPDDLRAASGGWEAAAGSRMAQVTVTSGATAACALPATPTVRILDAAGNVLLESEPGSAPQPARLEPGGETTVALQFGNWCEPNAAFPLRPVLVVDDTAGVAIDGLELASTDDAPPCNGPGQEPVLTTTAWGG